jgi:hypothetical protein
MPPPTATMRSRKRRKQAKYTETKAKQCQMQQKDQYEKRKKRSKHPRLQTSHRIVTPRRFCPIGAIHATVMRKFDNSGCPQSVFIQNKFLTFSAVTYFQVAHNQRQANVSRLLKLQ